MDCNKALLIIDLQNDYFEGGANPLSGGIEAASKAKEILNFFRNNNLPVFHIQHLALRPGSSFLIPNSKGADIHELVKPEAGEKIIVKNFPNSFRETKLLNYLQELNIKELVVCGMMTHMCVDATVRAAKDFGFHVTLIGDACATKTLEIDDVTIEAKNVHHAFLAALSYYYADVIKAAAFLSK
jgi:nicotinamidase-related amidase